MITFLRVLATAVAAVGVGAVAFGWVFAGPPEDGADTVNCVLTHLVALFNLGVAAFVWRVRL